MPTESKIIELRRKFYGQDIAPKILMKTYERDAEQIIIDKMLAAEFVSTNKLQK
jgi:hypothetical protein